MRASLLLVLLSRVALADAPSPAAPAPSPDGGAPVDPYPDPPAQSPPAESPPAQSPPAKPSQSPSPAAPPAQSPPPQSPPAQSPPPQSPPAQPSPSQAPTPPSQAPAPPSPSAAEPASAADSAAPAPPAPPPLPKNALGLTIPPAEAIPATCKALAKDASAPALNRALSARISLATCIADVKLKPIALCDCEQSVREVDAATQLPILLLDEVYAKGDPAMQILARHAKGDLLAGLVQRMLATIPPAVTASPSAIQLRQTRLDMLQPLIDPWQTQAQASFTEIDKIARANPQLSKNPAVVTAVRASRAKLTAPGVARR